MAGPKILLVDDEASVRKLLSEALSVKGFRVTSAKDGMESLKYMNSDNFDLIITDINMPNLDGIELLKKMKAAGRKEKVVIMTGTAFDSSSISEELPLIYYQLEKPFKMDYFLNVVSSALKSKRRSIDFKATKKKSRKSRKCYSN